MRIGETIATYDVGLALRGRSGKFEITSPTGEIYDVTCKPAPTTSNLDSKLEWSNDGTEHSPFFIRKVAEKSAEAETKSLPTGISEEKSQTASSALPFVLDHAAKDANSSNAGNLELSYLDDDPEVGQPSACVYLKGGLRDSASGGEVWITSRCNF